ncbi:MAG: GNAT family N-acetyltransferase [Bacteroidota bacterium]
MRNYKCLKSIEFSDGGCTLIPLRDEDKYDIANWRNSQINILRQTEFLTVTQQETYFADVVDKLFTQEQPDQLLFSFLENDQLIGYGGLVHIDWKYRTAEISFLTETSRNADAGVFISDWTNYLSILKCIADKHLHFNSIYTYAYDIRPNLYVALEASGFVETKRLKKDIEIDGELKDVVIHSYNFNALNMHFAGLSDTDLYYKWANDLVVRQNSFNSSEIQYEQHVGWFTKKLNSPDCFFYLFSNQENIPVGQVRIDKSNSEVVIGISIDEKFRGKGFGVEMLNRSCYDYLNKFPKEQVIAYVKEENTSSVKLFSKAGFVKTSDVEVNGSKSYRFKKINI